MSIRRTGNEESSSSSKNAASLDFVLSIVLARVVVKKKRSGL
jgi:hypothetical protein